MILKKNLPNTVLPNPPTEKGQGVRDQELGPRNSAWGGDMERKKLDYVFAILKPKSSLKVFVLLE